MSAIDPFRILGPVRLAFIGSLLLSFIAVSGGALINKDGIFYIETSRTILEQGLGGTREIVGLQFLPLLIAGLHKLSGLQLGTAANLLNALFMAGSCAMLVAITRKRLPEAAWAACLVALAMPAYNGYRGDILREYGFWFLCLLAFWLAMRWEETNRMREAVASQLALGCAALFRLEALAFIPALVFWQLFAAPPGLRLRRVIVVGCLPLSVAVLTVVLFGTGLVSPPDRLAYYLEAINPVRKLQIFNEAAGSMSELVLKNKYSREEAGYILFFGLLSIIPMKFLKMTGVFVVPLIFQFAERPARTWLSRWQPLPWAFLTYGFVLSAFVTHQLFLTGRYVSMLNLLSVPVAASGLAMLMQRFPRWRVLMVALAIVTMISNVVSIMPRKTHIVEAGSWLAAQSLDASRVGVDNARIAYYAGWSTTKFAILDRPALAQALRANRLDMIAVEVPSKDPGFEEWIASNRLQIAQRFTSRAGDAIVVVRAAPGEPSDALPAPTKTSK